MIWLQPAIWGLSLIILPLIILMYLLRRKYQPQTIASTLLWQQLIQSIEANHLWQKLKQHWLLWLQLLVAVLLILALSRPAIESEGLKAQHAIILIDVSGSMLTQENKQTRFEKAQEEVGKLISNLNADQTITLIEMGQTPKVLESKNRDQRKLTQTLQQMKPKASSSQVEQALTLAYAIASEEEHAEIVMVSDGAGTEEIKQKPHRFIQVGKATENSSVGMFQVNQEGGFARIDHNGKRPSTVAITLKNDVGQLIDMQTITLQGQSSQVLKWRDLPPADAYHLQIEADTDRLATDNERFAYPVSAAKKDVQYVGEEQFFIAKSLGLSKNITLLKGDQIEPNLNLYVMNKSKKSAPDRGNLLLISPPKEKSLFNVRGTKSVGGKVTQAAKHPIMKGLKFQAIYAENVLQVNPPAGIEPLLVVEGVPIVLAGEHQGRRIVYFAVDLDQTDLPLQPSFPILMSQIMNWLNPQEETQGHVLQVGESIQFPVPAQWKDVSVKSDHGEQEIEIIASGMVHFQAPEQAGQYDFIHPENQSIYRTVHVVFPLAESKITPVAAKTTPLASEAVSNHTGIYELWWWVAIVALMVLGLEWVVFGRGY
ncbi:VWA domain-containing protein [Hazenella sp. IB182353]|uniref:vWA domain-containing protein n=1 Tax=Polycladospora coralii TaxID=2771432 RepID=UPI001746EE67|nr:VWA domain-containing protein [Polycladospora coralii]MBS7531058.1 VWA domain-containing protein [Polycladospora coralii]